jgi:hypothetical protein
MRRGRADHTLQPTELFHERFQNREGQAGLARLTRRTGSREVVHWLGPVCDDEAIDPRPTPDVSQR